MKTTTLSNGCTWTTQAEATISSSALANASGTKHDAGKPQLSLLPLEGLTMAASALEYGAKKYARNNFKGGIAHSRLVDATLRHLNQYASGEAVDTESGLSHVSHALASLMMLAYMMKHKPELNDLEIK